MGKATGKKLRDRFLAWQCRIRQAAMREQGGRPSSGMRPRVLSRYGEVLAPALTTLLVPRDPATSTAFFRFQVMKAPDPRAVYEQGLAFLSADYFQAPESFSDRLTALLQAGSPLAATLLAKGRCVLEFSEGRQVYRLPVAVLELSKDDAAYQATLWHNRLFNPSLPDEVVALAFKPDWAQAAKEWQQAEDRRQAS